MRRLLRPQGFVSLAKYISLNLKLEQLNYFATGKNSKKNNNKTFRCYNKTFGSYRQVAGCSHKILFVVQIFVAKKKQTKKTFFQCVYTNDNTHRLDLLKT